MSDINVPVRDSALPRSFDDLRRIIIQRYRVIVTCFLALGLGIVAAYVLSPPLYTGETKLLVKQDRADSAVINGAAEPVAARDVLSETNLLSQVELIRGSDLLEGVAREVGLAERLIASGDARTDAEALAAATQSLRDDLLVTPVKRTWLIDVTYESPDPALARNVLDTLLKRYLEKNLSLHRPAGTYEFFTEQTRRAREDLDNAQTQLAAFTMEHHGGSPALERQDVVAKLVEFDSMRVQAAAMLAETNQRLRIVNQELARVPAQRTSETRTIDDAAGLQDVKARILTLETKRTDLLQKFKPGYRGIVEIDQELDSLRTALQRAAGTRIREETVADNPTRQWLDTELSRARAERAAIEARVKALGSAVSEYRGRAQILDVRDIEQQDLVRRVRETEEKYLLYAKKQEEARISDELDRRRIANVVVAQAPAIATEPERRPSLAILPFLFGASLLLSFGLALALDALAFLLRPAGSGAWTTDRPRHAVPELQPRASA